MAAITFHLDVVSAENWYHCERLHPDIRGWLEQNQVPCATVDHLLADESRPSFHPLDDENFMLIFLLWLSGYINS